MPVRAKSRTLNKFLFIVSSIIVLSGCTDDPKPVPVKNNTTNPDDNVPDINYTIAATLPHDTSSYTEGFLIHNQQLFESSGAASEMPYTRSLFGIVDLKTGKIDKKAELDREVYFGEGIIILKNKIYQLTWKNQTGFIYDEKTFKKIGQFNYQNKEGWGLTTDGTNIIMSDGTNNLTYLDPVTLKEIKTLSVSEKGYAFDNLNELEFINGFIYANVYPTNIIVKINPADGKIVGKLNFTALDIEAKNKKSSSEVLNGIAYDSLNNKIYVTGKLWQNIYQVEFPH